MWIMWTMICGMWICGKGYVDCDMWTWLESIAYVDYAVNS